MRNKFVNIEQQEKKIQEILIRYDEGLKKLRVKHRRELNKLLKQLEKQKIEALKKKLK